MGQAFIQATRQVCRRRSLSAAVIAIMAVSIGSCVAIFSMVKAVLLDGWGYADPDRIAVVWHARQGVAGVIGMSPSDFQVHQSTLTSANALAAVTTRGMNLGTGVSPSRITCARMTDGMFPLLGVRPARGRWMTADDDRAAAKVVVVSATLARQIAGSADAINSDISLDGVAHRVIGVMPASFAFPPEGIQGLAPADCWLPASFTPMELAIPSFSYVAFARLNPAAPLTQANAEAHAGARKIWSTYPAAVQSQVQLTARAVPFAEQALGRSRAPLMLFAGAVFGLLLIGCANVSNLLLTSFESRHAELAVRTSLGAPRRSLLAQLLIESGLLSAAGGIGGLAIAAGLVGAMVAANAAAFPRLAGAQIDGAALAFAIACAVLAGMASALWPALRASRAGALLQGVGTRVAARSFAGTTWRRGLIAFELALAVVVVILAGMLVRSMTSLNRIDPGFTTGDLLTFSVALPETRYQGREQIAAMADRLIDRLRALPRVTSASLSTAPPIGEATAAVVFSAAQATGPEYKPALIHAVSPDYARTLGLTLRAGRFLDVTDSAPVSPVAVINESFARAVFPDGRAIGGSFSRIGSPKPLTVVGVVADTRQAGPLRPAVAAFYVPFAQNDQPQRSLHLALRSESSGTRMVPAIRQVLGGLDAELPPFAIKTGVDLLSGTIATHRFNVFVIGVFAVFALILAGSGLYAVLAQSVQQARRDFGIRQALGATRGRIARSVLGRAMLPALAGIFLGAVAAASASKLIASQLFGIAPNDPATFIAAALLVLALSVLVVARPALTAAPPNLTELLR